MQEKEINQYLQFLLDYFEAEYSHTEWFREKYNLSEQEADDIEEVMEKIGFLFYKRCVY